MSDQGGYGWFNPADGASEYNRTLFIIKQMLGLIRTASLVQIKAIHVDDAPSPVGFVDVMPLVNMIDGQGNSSKHSTIYNLPYFRLQGGANAIIIDPQVDDIGIAVFADRDISSVKSTKAQANPGSRRRFDFADGLYIGGVLNAQPNQYILFSNTGIKVVDKNGNIIEMKLGSIAMTGNLTVTGSITAGQGTGDQVTLQHHVHSGVTAGGASTAAPTAGT